MLKNWKTTLLGVVYAAAVLLAQQVSAGSIDWQTILQAALGVLLGSAASDNLQAANVLQSIVLNWRTSVLGLLAGIAPIILQSLQGGAITTPVILKAVGVALLGLLVHDHANDPKAVPPAAPAAGTTQQS